jgi:hypothetical protein
VAGIGNGVNQPFDHPVRILDVNSDLTYSGATHQIKAGFSFKRYFWGFQRDFRVSGNLSYLSWEDFLLNRGDAFEGIQPGSPGSERDYRQSTIGMYVQDDINLLSNFTLNAGLRYEFITNPTETGGTSIGVVPQNWDETDDIFGVLSDRVFAKNPSLKNLSPRVGFAWALSPRSSLRGGWGRFYDQIFPLLYDNIRVPPQFMTMNLRASTLGIPIPYPDPVSIGVGTPILSPIGVDHYNENTTTIHQFNVTYQREILPQTVLQVGYQGSRAKYLPVGNDPNTRIPEFLPDGTIFFPASNPARKPNWGRLSILEWTGKAWYNSFPVSLNRRFRDGFQMAVNYTFSRNVDQGSGTIGGDAAQDNRARVNPYDIKSNQGLAAQHIAHQFKISSVYELPFGSGKRFGSDMSGVANALVSGWGVQGILTVRSGPPFSVTMGGDRARSLTASQRPSVKEGFSNNPIVGEIDQWYDPNAFERPAAGFFGDLGRNTLIGPGLATLDLSFVKNSTIGDSTFQVRVEFFNLLNRVNLGLPGDQVFTGGGAIPASAGRITDTSTTARQMQLAARFSF